MSIKVPQAEYILSCFGFTQKKKEGFFKCDSMGLEVWLVNYFLAYGLKVSLLSVHRNHA